jgi:hypothetical protein
MKNIFRVTNLSVDEITNAEYDLAIFASGYEKRCTHFPRLLERSKVGTMLLLGFSEKGRDPQREINDKYFNDHWETAPILMSGNDETLLYQRLQRIGKDASGRLAVIVDYSSMTRVWYAAILNWARYGLGDCPVCIDFSYSVGQHRDDVEPLVIQSITAVPGCEGVTDPLGKSVAVFGLGFDAPASLCVLDRLEPNVVLGYFADPGAFSDYATRTQSANAEFIKNHTEVCVGLPLDSIEDAYRGLAELISPYRQNASITLIPMGPKPHVLTAILMSMKFPEITCLRVAGDRKRPERVDTTGQLVGTRVDFGAAWREAG